MKRISRLAIVLLALVGFGITVYPSLIRALPANDTANEFSPEFIKQLAEKAYYKLLDKDDFFAAAEAADKYLQNKELVINAYEKAMGKGEITAAAYIADEYLKDKKDFAVSLLKMAVNRLLDAKDFNQAYWKAIIIDDLTHDKSFSVKVDRAEYDHLISIKNFDKAFIIASRNLKDGELATKALQAKYDYLMSKKEFWEAAQVAETRLKNHDLAINAYTEHYNKCMASRDFVEAEFIAENCLKNENLTVKTWKEAFNYAVTIQKFRWAAYIADEKLEDRELVLKMYKEALANKNYLDAYKIFNSHLQTQ